MEVLMRAKNTVWIPVLILILIPVVVVVGGCLTEVDWNEHSSGGDDTSPDNPCAGISCNGNGTCYWGICSCYDGYAGASCERCASGYSGYPWCEEPTNLCKGVDCNGHGSCKPADGKCSCQTGYTGASCDRCASGYEGYPSCTKKKTAPPCTCSAGQQECLSASTYKYCKDGCYWTIQACSQACSTQKSSGCDYSTKHKVETCFCASPGWDWKVFRFTDSCTDGSSTSLALYDVSDGYKLVKGPYTLNDGDKRVINLSCKTGHKICYGAWTSDGYWGCGKGCKEGCKSCCWTCGDGSIKAQASLTCT
jgi:hypothetical protein